MPIDVVLFQVPPTPTLMPVPTAPIDIPSFGLWEPASDLLQLWNQNSQYTTGIQHAIFISIVVIGIMVLVHLIRSMGSDNE